MPRSLYCPCGMVNVQFGPSIPAAMVAAVAPHAAKANRCPCCGGVPAPVPPSAEAVRG